jgi:hypothetical protein
MIDVDELNDSACRFAAPPVIILPHWQATTVP